MTFMCADKHQIFMLRNMLIKHKKMEYQNATDVYMLIIYALERVLSNSMSVCACKKNNNPKNPEGLYAVMMTHVHVIKQYSVA